jgi:Leucine-rich repeat (LRR) protein
VKEVDIVVPLVQESLTPEKKQELKVIELTNKVDTMERKMNELVKTVNDMKKRNRGFISLPSCPYVIPDTCKTLELVNTIKKFRFRFRFMYDELEFQFIFNHADISNIRYLEHLEELSISHNTATSDFSPIAGCKSLRGLFFINCEKLTDLAFCAHLQTLRVLMVKKCANLKSVDIVRLMPDLTELHIIGCPNIKIPEDIRTPNLTIVRE